MGGGSLRLTFPLTSNRERWRKTGLLLSVMSLILFTGYIGWIGLGFVQRVPCNCAGILNSLGWEEHFIMNLWFIALGIYGLYPHPIKKPKADASGSSGC
ncbi:MauE/DoxX family redox-associated membrane protein [Algoriphagus resistens]|uniref:MauE/DoxX family redox-associated membrane protein n=1 Tax=Algoriphagus resistens TaxID=1750590 RepID=UPI00373FD696